LRVVPYRVELTCGKKHTNYSRNTGTMQALAINFSQQVFQTIVQYGPINFAAIASKLESTPSVVSKTVYQLVKRSYVGRIEDAYGNVTFKALVAEKDVTFYNKYKPAATLFVARERAANKAATQAATVTKAQVVQDKPVTRLEEIFNYIADFAKPSLNPTEVHEAFPDLTYSMVASAMHKLVNKHKYLKNDGGQYSISIKKEDAVFGYTSVEIKGEQIHMKSKDALTLFKQLQKHYG
jgi:Mn-dependent DtxR family transcriptional regulator